MQLGACGKKKVFAALVRGVAVVAAVVVVLVADGDEVLAELLRDGGGLLGDNGLVVHADDQSWKRIIILT